MLYLPTVSFAQHEIRLPALSQDVCDLCQLVVEPQDVLAKTTKLLHSSPGLLLFVADRFRQDTNQPVADLQDLCDWIRQSLFVPLIESDAFALVEQFGWDHQEKLRKWRAKPTKKRLVKYVACNSELNSRQAKQFVNDTLIPTFPLIAGDTSITGTEQDLAFESQVHSSARLPIRQMWLLCSKLQSLQREFKTRLHNSKMQSLKQLAYGASHEINNPLANIATRAQSLLLEETKSSRRQRLAVIYSQAMRAHEMIADMMLFAYPPELQFTTTEIAPVIQQVVQEIQNELDETDVSVSIRQYPEVPLCELDSTQLAVAIKALLQNAIIATGSGCEIRIQIWRRNEQCVAVAVNDNGPGVCDSIADKVFDPFYSGREAGRGLGFGLSKAWRIAELHRGELTLESRCNEGARFVLTIPIQQSGRQKSTSRIDNVRAA